MRKQLLNFIGLVFLVSFLLILVFPGILFHDIIEARIIKAIKKIDPAAEVILKKSRYNLWQNSFKAEEFGVKASHIVAFHVTDISVRRIQWLKILLKGRITNREITRTTCDARSVKINLDWKGYYFSCRDFHISVPHSEINADSVIYHTLGNDDHFFSRSDYRKTRINASINSIKIVLPFFPEEWKDDVFRIRHLLLDNVTLSLAVDKYKKFAPGKPKGIMPNEQLASSGIKIEMDSLTLKNGRLIYAEIMEQGRTPAVVSFGDLNVKGYKIGNLNHGDTSLLFIQARLMDTAKIQLKMKYPLNSEKLYVLLNGSMGGFNLSKLNSFIVPAQHIRIASGVHERTNFNIRFVDRNAKGTVHSFYSDLKVEFVDSEGKKKQGILRELGSLLANVKLKNSNMPDKEEVGEVNYSRQEKDSFIRFIWLAVRNGIGDIAGFGKKKPVLK